MKTHVYITRKDGMIKMETKYTLTNKHGKVVLESNSPIEIFIGGVAYQEFNVPIVHLPRLVSAAVDCYLKADTISLGHYADFVGKHYKKVLNAYETGSRWDVLGLYWDSEEYASSNL